MLKRLLWFLTFTVLSGAIFAALSPSKVVQMIDRQFYYPQKAKIKGFKMRVLYSGVEDFVNSKIDPAAGEKKGKVYAVFSRKNGLSFDVSRMPKRLQGAVNAILREQRDLILPKPLAESLKQYKIKLHREGALTKLYAYVPKGTRATIVRIEYFYDKNYRVRRTHAFLHTGEQVDSKWDLIRNRYGKYMIQKNTIILSLVRGRVAQQIEYEYRPVKGVYLPSKITIKSRFENGKTRKEKLEFSEYEVY